MKKITVLLVALSFVFAAVASAQTAAKPATTAPTAKSAETTVIDAGNKTCPVEGGPVNGKDFVVYKGVKYGLCCPGCDKAFLKDPEKYIQKLKDKGEIK